MKSTKKRRSNGEGAVYQDGKSWKARLKIGTNPKNGRPIFAVTRATTKTLACEALRRLQMEHAKGLLATGKEHTLEAFVESWLEHQIKPNKAPKTYASYSLLLRKYVLPTLGKKRMDQVSRADIRNLFCVLQQQPLSPRGRDTSRTGHETLSRGTLSAIKRTLSSAFSDAKKDDIVAKNPCEDVEIPGSKQRETIHLTEEQIIKLVNAAIGHPLELFLQFLIVSAARNGEARGLRWQDVNWDQSGVIIRSQLQRLEGKLQLVDHTKTNQVRFLELPHEIMEGLSKLKKSQEAVGVMDFEGVVFLNHDGRRLDEKFVNKQLQELCRKAGIPPVSAHKIRHTAATLAHGETGDMGAVQKLLGHSQISLTANLYAHATQKTIAKATSALGRIVFKDSEASK